MRKKFNLIRSFAILCFDIALIRRLKTALRDDKICENRLYSHLSAGKITLSEYLAIQK